MGGRLVNRAQMGAAAGRLSSGSSLRLQSLKKTLTFHHVYVSHFPPFHHSEFYVSHC